MVQLNKKLGAAEHLHSRHQYTNSAECSTVMEDSCMDTVSASDLHLY